MWQTLVIIVRFPVFLLGLAALTVLAAIALSVVGIGSALSTVLELVFSPMGILGAIYRNKPEDVEKLFQAAFEWKEFPAIYKFISELYSDLVKWGFAEK